MSVGWSPEGKVWHGSEPSSSLDRLVGWSILTETDRVVGGDLNDSEVRQGRETDGAGGVRDEVEESGTEWNDTSVGGETVTDGSHTVFSNTESKVSTGVASKTRRWVLEVLGTLPSGQVGSGQIGRTTNELGKDLGKLGDGRLGELSGSDSGILGSVGGEGLLPSLWESSLNSSLEFGSLLGILLLVLSKELVPLGLELGSLLSGFVVKVVSLLGNGKGLLGVEAELLLELGNVVLLESWDELRDLLIIRLLTSTVDVVSTLLGGTETDGSLEVDDGWGVGRLLGLGDGSFDRVVVAECQYNSGLSSFLHSLVTLLDVKNVPSVRLVSGLDVLGEGDGSVTVNGDF